MLASSSLIFGRLLDSADSSVGSMDLLQNDFDLLIIDSLYYSSDSSLIASAVDTYRSRYEIAAENGFNWIVLWKTNYHIEIVEFLAHLSFFSFSFNVPKLTITGIPILFRNSRSFFSPSIDDVHYKV